MCFNHINVRTNQNQMHMNIANVLCVRKVKDVLQKYKLRTKHKENKKNKSCSKILTDRVTEDKKENGFKNNKFLTKKIKHMTHILTDAYMPVNADLRI